VAEFYPAGSGTIPPLPWQTFPPPFSLGHARKSAIETYHLNCTSFEPVVERKLRRRQLAEDGNVEITGRDLRNGPAGDSLGSGAHGFQYRQHKG
jgi:hypothetical protein